MKRTGFTLIELLLTVSIILVVGLLSTGFYARFLSQNSTINAVNQLAADFRKAQMYSMMGKYSGSYQTWGVHYASNKITLYLSDSAQSNLYNSRNTAFDEIYTVPSNVTIFGFADVYFARVTGLPSATQSITISSGSTTRTITINSQGVVNR